MHMAIEQSFDAFWLNPICTCQAVEFSEMKRRWRHMCKRSNDNTDNWDAPRNWTNRNHNDDDDTLECAHMATTAKQGGHLSFNINIFVAVLVYLGKWWQIYVYDLHTTRQCSGVCQICYNRCGHHFALALMTSWRHPIGINFIAGPAVFWIQQLCARRCYPTTSPFLCKAM